MKAASNVVDSVALRGTESTPDPIGTSLRPPRSSTLAAGRPAALAGNAKITDLSWVRVLYELGQTAANGADPLRVRQDILTHIVQGFEAESGSIALIVEGTQDQLEIVVGTDLPVDALGSRPPRGVGVFGHVVATGQPLLINGGVAET